MYRAHQTRVSATCGGVLNGHAERRRYAVARALRDEGWPMAWERMREHRAFTVGGAYCRPSADAPRCAGTRDCGAGKVCVNGPCCGGPSCVGDWATLT